MAGAPGRKRPPSTTRHTDTSLGAILDANADGIVVVRQDGVVCFANRAAEQLFARPAADLVGEVFGFPLVVDSTTELDVITRRGAHCVVEMRVVEIVWEGEPACQASLRDVTDRKQAEAERAALIQEQARRIEAEAALRDRDEFLEAIAHELRTPLTRLRLGVQLAHRRLIKEGLPLPRGIDEAFQQIELETQHLSQLAKHLLDLPKIESGTLVLYRSQVDLRQLVQAAVAAARLDVAAERCLLRFPSQPVMISADQQVIEQIVASAIGNALRQSPPDQPIEVSLSVRAWPTLPERASRMAQLSVRDHGVVVPPEEHDRLFGRSLEVYSNAYASGLGVWLYVSRRLAELHDGGIDTEFPDDGGTRVILRLPLTDPT